MIPLLLLCLCHTLFRGPAELPYQPPLALMEELGIRNDSIQTSNGCTLYLVHHGTTDWSLVGRLQGWSHVHLNPLGIREVEKTAKLLKDRSITVIYSSPLQQAVETAKILQKACHCPVKIEENLKGEFHGLFEGMSKEQYTKEPHFQHYDTLAPEEEIFFPCGQGGESKVTMARRLLPVIHRIAAEHPGENVVIVTHGGLFKLLNLCLGKASEEGTLSIPNGSLMVLKGDSTNLYLR